jgi:prepilin-type N-terminal cleavage/methylation domain-containing protein
MKQQAFTLVELIVVITILAILGTIGFVSLSGYTLQARDSTRLTDVATLTRSLEIVRGKGYPLPLPDAAVVLSASGVSIGYQGYMGSGALKSIGVGGSIADPLDDSLYTYSVNTLQNKYQLVGFSESSGVAYIPTPSVSVAYATDYSSRSVVTQ